MAADPVSDEAARWLNLIRGSPTFVVKESAGGSQVLQIEQIPDLSGAWWVCGTVTTSGGHTFEAVHVVSTDDGGELLQTYVWADGWLTIASLAERRGMSARDVFPFDHTFAVPLERDVFHD